MKKRAYSFIIVLTLLLFATLTGCRHANVNVSEDNDSAEEIERVYKELKELVDEYDRIMPYSWAGDLESDAAMTEVCQKISEVTPRYFALAEPDRTAERQAALASYDAMPRTVVAYVHAKELADRFNALWEEFQTVKADSDPAHEEENRKKLLNLQVEFFQYGIYLPGYQNSTGERSVSPELVRPFRDNDGFMELMDREGFKVLSVGTGILASGVDGKGFEWRVVGDEPDAELNKIALVVRNDEGTWEIKQVSDVRDECGEGLSLYLTESESYDPYYGPVDEEQSVLYGGRRHNVHFFYQSDRAIEQIDPELLGVLMPRNTTVQIWQRDQSFLIHLAYSGTYGLADELSHMAPDIMYYTLKGLGVVR